MNCLCTIVRCIHAQLEWAVADIGLDVKVGYEFEENIDAHRANVASDLLFDVECLWWCQC